MGSAEAQLDQIADSITEINIDILDLTAEREAWRRKVRSLVQEAFDLGRSAS